MVPCTERIVEVPERLQESIRRMTTQLQPILKPDKVPSANEGHVIPLSADERLLRKAVARCLKAQVAEVHERLTGGAVEKGGPGSGNFGHEGRPGEVGGSGRGSGGGTSTWEQASTIQELRKFNGGIGSAYDGELNFYDRAVIPLHNNNNSKPLRRFADEHPAEFEAYRRASIFEAWKDSRTDIPLGDWIKSDVAIFRGVYQEGKEEGTSWSFSRRTADYFAKYGPAHGFRGEATGTGKILETSIKPQDLFYYSNAQGEQEVLKKSYMPVSIVILKSQSPASAVPSNLTKWDQAVVQEVRPIWFGLFKKGGDRAMKEIRRFPRHARKMVVFSKGMVEESERVAMEIQDDGRKMFYIPRDGYKFWVAGEVKGGPGSGNFGHVGRPGEVGGSGEGGGSSVSTELSHVELWHGTSADRANAIATSGFKVGSGESTGGAGFYGEGIYFGGRLQAETYAQNPDSLVKVRIDAKNTVLWNSSDNKKIIDVVKERVPKGTTVLDPDHSKNVTSGYSRLFDLGDHVVPRMYTEVAKEMGFDSVWNKETGEVVVFDASLVHVAKETKSLKATPSIVIPEWIEDPDVLDALEREMFKFAQGIDQTTADARGRN
jgi:hypothetical protein